MLHSLSRREYWMHPLEWRAARRIRKHYLTAFRKAHIPIELPIIELLHEYLCARIQTGRLERALLEPIPNDPTLPLPTITPAHLDLLQKNQEKLRKLRSELTSLLPKPVPCPPDPFAQWAKKMQEAAKQTKEEKPHQPEPEATEAPTGERSATALQTPAAPDPMLDSPLRTPQRSSAALPNPAEACPPLAGSPLPSSPSSPISPIRCALRSPASQRGPISASDPTPTTPKPTRNPNIPPFQFLCDRPKPGGCTVIYTTPPDKPPKPRKPIFDFDPYP